MALLNSFKTGQSCFCQFYKKQQDQASEKVILMEEQEVDTHLCASHCMGLLLKMKMEVVYSDLL